MNTIQSYIKRQYIKIIILLAICSILLLSPVTVVHADIADGSTCTVTEISGPASAFSTVTGNTDNNYCCAPGDSNISCQRRGWSCNSVAPCVNSSAPKGGGNTAECNVTCINSTFSVLPLRPCSTQAFIDGHRDLCNCEYDTTGANSLAAGVYNGNTYTAFGCIPQDIGNIMNFALSLAISIGVIASLIIIIAGGYIIMTNPGDAEQVGKGKKLISNAAVGLIVVIFCVIVLKILGIDILGINELTSLII